MSHTNPAPWKPLFSQHLEKIGGGDSAEFYLATVTKDGLPRVRTCIHRGFWTSLPENPKNKLTKNPPALYESDCPTFTTDARMRKVGDLFSSAEPGQEDVVVVGQKNLSGSGGGAPVEAVYWIKDTMAQWRIRGKCWLLAADDIEESVRGEEEEVAQHSGALRVKTEVGRYMRPIGDVDLATDGGKSWSWRTEVENYFENLSPMMRGTFKNPPPGKPVKDGSDGPGEAIGQKAGHLQDEDLARKNFRVAIITPEEVEQLDLSDPENCRRLVWTLLPPVGPASSGHGETKTLGEWNVVETWP